MKFRNLLILSFISTALAAPVNSLVSPNSVRSPHDHEQTEPCHEDTIQQPTNGTNVERIKVRSSVEEAKSPHEDEKHDVQSEPCHKDTIQQPTAGAEAQLFKERAPLDHSARSPHEDENSATRDPHDEGSKNIPRDSDVECKGC
jgi:hypothetical protein